MAARVGNPSRDESEVAMTAAALACMFQERSL